jgi:hypothetical protein
MESVTEARRAKFEAWVINFHRGSSLDCEIHSDERYPSLNGQWIYDDWNIQSAWAAYNAALDSLVIELPSEECVGPSYDSYMAMDSLAVRQAIEKAGVKTK